LNESSALLNMILMKRKVVKLLLAINSLLIFFYFFPVSVILSLRGFISNSFFGEADGPTALFFSFTFEWYLVVMLVLEIFLIAYLLMNRLKK
jgi:hypothetical protein